MSLSALDNAERHTISERKFSGEMITEVTQIFPDSDPKNIILQF